MNKETIDFLKRIHGDLSAFSIMIARSSIPHNFDDPEIKEIEEVQVIIEKWVDKLKDK